jgi:hypothetical protein
MAVSPVVDGDGVGAGFTGGEVVAATVGLSPHAGHQPSATPLMYTAKTAPAKRTT